MRQFLYEEKTPIAKCEAIEDPDGLFHAVATTAKGEKWLMNFKLGKTVAQSFAQGVTKRGWVARDAWKVQK